MAHLSSHRILRFGLLCFTVAHLCPLRVEAWYKHRAHGSVGSDSNAQYGGGRGRGRVWDWPGGGLADEDCSEDYSEATTSTALTTAATTNTTVAPTATMAQTTATQQPNTAMAIAATATQTSTTMGPSTTAPTTTAAPTTGVVASTTTAPTCACPSGTCGFIIDSDAATTNSISMSQLRSVGSCRCANAEETQGCYEAQPDMDTNQLDDSFIIYLQCPTAADFCVCDVDGECYTSILDDSLSDIQFVPYQDAGGCYVYASPSCVGGDFSQNDGLVGNLGTTFTCSQADGIIGSNTSYIKALSASCNGCTAIAAATASTCAASTFTPAGKRK